MSGVLSLLPGETDFIEIAVVRARARVCVYVPAKVVLRCYTVR